MAITKKEYLTECAKITAENNKKADAGKKKDAGNAGSGTDTRKPGE